jgi:hypothetical protein
MVCLHLDVERSKEDSWDLSDFVEGKWDSKTSNDVIGHQCYEEVLLLDCVFVVAKNKGFLNVIDLVLFVEKLKGPVQFVGENLLHLTPAQMSFEDRLEHLNGLELQSVT